MKKNKKILAASLATTLVVGSVAGLPLSAKGLLSHLGGVAAAQALSNTEILDQLTDVYAQLSTEEKDAIDAARAKLNSIVTSGPDAESELVFPVWNAISKKNAAVTQKDLLELIKDMGFIYNPAFSGLEAAITDADNRAVLAELARAAGGFSGSENEFSFDDALDFADAVKAELKVQLTAKTADQLLVYAQDPAEAKKVLKDALHNVLAKTDLDISKLIANLGLTENELMEVYDLLNQRVDTADNAAQKALISAYVKSESDITLTSTSDWRKQTLGFKAFDTALPSGVVSYSIDGADKDKFEVTTDGALKLKDAISTTTTANLTITATVLKGTSYERVLLKKDTGVTFTAPVVDSGNNSGNNGGIIGGNSGNNGEVKGPDAGKAAEVIAENIAKIEALLKNPNAGNGLKKAQEAIQEAIREAAKIDVSATVKVEGDVAKPNLDAKKIADVFKSVKDIAKSANDKLKEAAPDAKPAKVIATLDLGTVTAGTTEIPLSQEILAAAKENGIDTIAVQVNGITLAVDVDQLAAATTITIKKEAKSVATSATQLNVASDVYEFNFESDGKKIENFSKPVEVKIPVANIAAGVDSDLLVLAKILDGQLIFKGGQYNAEKKEFVAQNKSFSTYAVVENKVSFEDTASVSSWAGRQIAVVAAKGIVEGRAEGQYAPAGQVTRAEFAKMIVKSFGLEDASAVEAFADVSDNDWFKPYVAAAVKAGLIDGRTDTSFVPNATITRAEMATIAARALTKIKEYKVPVNDDALKAFADAASINSTLTSGVALAAEQGIVVGEDNNQFNPNNNSTRAQAAVVIYRLLSK